MAQWARITAITKLFFSFCRPGVCVCARACMCEVYVCMCLHMCGTFTNVHFHFQKQVLEKREAARHGDVEVSAPTSKPVRVMQISVVVL